MRGCPAPGRLARVRPEDGNQLRAAAAPLAGVDQRGQRPAAALPDEMDLAGHAAPGTVEPFVGAVLR